MASCFDLRGYVGRWSLSFCCSSFLLVGTLERLVCCLVPCVLVCPLFWFQYCKKVPLQFLVGDSWVSVDPMVIAVRWAPC